MTATFAFGRVFAMSTFEALRLVRTRRPDHPALSTGQVIEIIQSVQADGAAHDFEGAIYLDPVIPTEAPHGDAKIFYRSCVEILMLAHRPVWTKTLIYGRKALVQKLESDEAQCFAAAGLMEETDEAVVGWWDRMAGLSRMGTDQEKMKRAREAERLTMDHERDRLARIGIDKSPVWMALEDNWAGYDVLSYDQGASGPVSRLLEVKSTTASPLRFYVTRREWETCMKMGAAYHFHVWDMNTGNLFERSGEEVTKHIPSDNGKGRWSNVEILVSA